MYIYFFVSIAKGLIMQSDSVTDVNQENFLRLASQVFQPGPGARRVRRRERDKVIFLDFLYSENLGYS